MVRIVVTPTWAKLIDFETTLPSAVEELIRQRDERRPRLSSAPQTADHAQRQRYAGASGCSHSAHGSEAATDAAKGKERPDPFGPGRFPGDP